MKERKRFTKDMMKKRQYLKLKKKLKRDYILHKKSLKHKEKFQKDDWNYKITLFPREIQAKIYILTWKLFWKSYVPLIAKPPSWIAYANYVKKISWEARQNNIHFSHLPFNTLPENKEWIMGCQCKFCLNDEQITVMEKHMHSLIQYRNSNYFNDKLMPYESTSYWNERFILSGGIFVKVFDPLCGSYKENKFTKKLREGYKFEFDYIGPQSTQPELGEFTYNQ